MSSGSVPYTPRAEDRKNVPMSASSQPAAAPDTDTVAADPLADLVLSPARVLDLARGVRVVLPGRHFAPVEPAMVPVESVLVEMELAGLSLTRASAMAGLLDRVTSDPFYMASDGVRRDLRDILPPSVERVLSVQDDIDGELRRESASLEAAVLPLAASIAFRAGEPERVVENSWRIAAWMFGRILRSPLHVGDPSPLLNRVRERLPDAAEPPASDALDLRRFGFASPASVDLVEFAYLQGILWHHFGPTKPQSLLPPVVRFLQRLARRPMSFAERDIEAALADGRNALGWRAPHAAPTVAARWILTRTRAPWLKDAAPTVLTEALRMMLDAPERYAWVASAVFLEGRELPLAQAEETLYAWRDPRAEQIPVHLRLSMAAGLLARAEAADRARVLALIPECSQDWRPFVVDALLDAEGTTADFVASLLRALRTLAEDEAADRKARLNAFMMLLRRIGAQSQGEDDINAWIARAGRQPPFSENAAIRREVNSLVHRTERKVVG